MASWTSFFSERLGGKSAISSRSLCYLVGLIIIFSDSLLGQAIPTSDSEKQKKKRETVSQRLGESSVNFSSNYDDSGDGRKVMYVT